MRLVIWIKYQILYSNFHKKDGRKKGILWRLPLQCKSWIFQNYIVFIDDAVGSGAELGVSLPIYDKNRLASPYGRAPSHLSPICLLSNSSGCYTTGLFPQSYDLLSIAYCSEVTCLFSALSPFLSYVSPLLTSSALQPHSWHDNGSGSVAFLWQISLPWWHHRFWSRVNV